jgi:hypothetical protein
MFERNRVDNAPEVSAVPVEITSLDGTLSKGKLLVPVPKSVAEALNGAAAFIEFEPYGGEKRYLAKAQLAAVKPLGVPRLPSLQGRLRQSEDFDPHAVLGVPCGAAGRRSARPMWRSPRPIILIVTPMSRCRPR